MKLLRNVIPIALCLSLSACTQAQILTDLDFASVAFAAVATVPGLPPSVALGLSEAGTEVDCVSAAVEQGGTSAQVGTNIATCGLKLVSTVVPPGTPLTIVNLLSALNIALQKVINDNKVLPVAMDSVKVPFTNSFASVSKDGKFNLGKGGKKKVAAVRKRIADSKAKLPVPVKK